MHQAVDGHLPTPRLIRATSATVRNLTSATRGVSACHRVVASSVRSRALDGIRRTSHVRLQSKSRTERATPSIASLLLLFGRYAPARLRGNLRSPALSFVFRGKRFTCYQLTSVPENSIRRKNPSADPAFARSFAINHHHRCMQPVPGKYGTACVHDRGVHAIAGDRSPRRPECNSAGRTVRHPAWARFHRSARQPAPARRPAPPAPDRAGRRPPRPSRCVQRPGHDFPPVSYPPPPVSSQLAAGDLVRQVVHHELGPPLRVDAELEVGQAGRAGGCRNRAG